MKRLGLLFTALLLAIVLPVAGAFLIAFLQPPPYRMVAEPGPEWSEGQVAPSGARALVTETENEGAARTAARRIAEEVDFASRSSILDVYRYRVSGSDEHGIVFPLGRYAVHLRAPDEAALEEALASLPFVERDEGAGLYGFIEPNTGLFIAILAGYVLLIAVLFFVGLRWASRRPPVPGREAVSEDVLRARLLATEGVTAQEGPGQEINLSVPERPGETLRLRLDPGSLTVRALLSDRPERRQNGGSGVSRTWSFQRTVPVGKHWSDAPARAVQEAGWTWQPVLTSKGI